jgi:LAO/AO transport system kinase
MTEGRGDFGDFFKGDNRSLARAISMVEDRSPEGRALLRKVFPFTGHARVIGITGSPGSGKSSLVDRLAVAYRKESPQVGVIAVDPSSPFTGGAILGDRIRMQTLSTDPGIYIRSMATRGHLGGLAPSTADVIRVLDAGARDPILVETVGVGQDEIDIVKLADVSVVVLVPGMGDDVQALKAGIMEIGDIFVINKCDRPGVEKMERALMSILSLAHREDGWIPPIVKTVATEGRGVEELKAQIDQCLARMQGSAERMARRRQAAREQLARLVQERVVEETLAGAFEGEALNSMIDRIARNEEDPHTVVERLVARPSPSGRRWPEGPDEGPTSPKQSPSPGAHLLMSHPLPQGEGKHKIDHIGIAVKSIPAALQIYQGILGLQVSGYEDVEEQGVRVAMLPIGDTRIELLEPLHENSPIAKFMSKRGEGIHHIAICVDNIESALDGFKAAGARLIDTSPRRGAANSKIAFIHPAGMHGVLLELVEHDK